MASPPVPYFSLNVGELEPDDAGRVWVLQADQQTKVHLHKDSIESLTLAMDMADTVFPTAIFQLKNLRVLLLPMRGFRSIPQGISQLKRLETLDINHGALVSLPDDFCQLSSLKSASFLYSPLERLPDRIGELKKLEMLHLGFTRITALPESMQHLSALKSLLLQNTPDQPHLSQEAVEQLKTNLPNCNIHYRIVAVQ
ncbi:MAG TPA: hypothetical protein VK168_11125 [Saprospiraceae bacterium]|nr:hypothetical protein [Saprospiraceae bacterium]